MAASRRTPGLPCQLYLSELKASSRLRAVGRVLGRCLDSPEMGNLKCCCRGVSPSPEGPAHCHVMYFPRMSPSRPKGPTDFEVSHITWRVLAMRPPSQVGWDGSLAVLAHVLCCTVFEGGVTGPAVATQETPDTKLS